VARKWVGFRFGVFKLICMQIKCKKACEAFMLWKPFVFVSFQCQCSAHSCKLLIKNISFKSCSDINLFQQFVLSAHINYLRSYLNKYQLATIDWL